MLIPCGKCSPGFLLNNDSERHNVQNLQAGTKYRVALRAKGKGGGGGRGNIADIQAAKGILYESTLTRKAEQCAQIDQSMLAVVAWRRRLGLQ